MTNIALIPEDRINRIEQALSDISRKINPPSKWVDKDTFLLSHPGITTVTFNSWRKNYPHLFKKIGKTLFINIDEAFK